MKISAQWIADQIDPKLSTSAVAQALEAAGLEVDAIEEAVALDAKIVVARITAVRPHPNAERLNLCAVEYGATSPVEVICGAPNVAVGLTVAYARPGSLLPGGTKIEAATLRGIESKGMLCSADELGLGDDHSGLLDLGAEAKVGQPASSVLGNDDIIELVASANRWDLLSVMGMAREAAAQLDKPLKSSAITPWRAGKDSAPGVKVQATADLRRFTLLRLDVKPGGVSPQWLQRRLLASGVRPISPIVDITNYVMIERGQPLHAFDADKVKGAVVVRRARAGESLVTLDAQHRQLSPDDLVIADGSGVIALAGVMGGQSTEVSSGTTSILLEAASFNGPLIRLMAQRHNLRSEASARFERQLPTAAVNEAVCRSVELLKQVSAAKVASAWSEWQPDAGKTTTIKLTGAWLGSYLGLPVTAKQAAGLLGRLQITAKATSDDLTVMAPWWRPDLQVREDITEEVIKLIGYDALPATLPATRFDVALVDRHQSSLVAIKQALTAFGLFEVGTYSFISPEQAAWAKGEQPLEIANPLSREQTYLRTELLPSLLAAAAHNQHSAPSFGLFELSRVYLPTKPGVLPDERLRVGILTYHQAGELEAYSTIKGAWQRLARSLNFDVSPQLPKATDTEGGRWFPRRWLSFTGVKQAAVGRLGQLHPHLTEKAGLKGAAGYAEFDVALLLASRQPRAIQPRRRFPVIDRDITVEVARTVLWKDIFDVIKTSKVANIMQILFVSDYYNDAVSTDIKRVTIRLTLGSDSATLTGGQADAAVGAIGELLSSKFAAKIA